MPAFISVGMAMWEKQGDKTYVYWSMLGPILPGLILPALVRLRLLYELPEGLAVLCSSARAGSAVG